MAHFDIRPDNTHEWVYEGIDWRERLLQQLGQAGLTAAECWFVDDEEGTERQITQKNCVAESNQTDNNYNVILLKDETDAENAKAFFRSDSNNPEAWDNVFNMVRGFAAYISTRYPREETVALKHELDIKELMEDLEGLDGAATS